MIPLRKKLNLKYLLCAGVFFCCGLLSSLSWPNNTKDTQLTALFLYNFANFAEWPDAAFKNKKASIKMCLYGDIKFANYLDAVDGTPIGNRPLNIYRTQQFEDIISGCHILFVAKDRKAELPKFWNNINYFYVLSVGEQKAFTDKGGIINIMQTENNLVFDINISNALEVGLHLDSDLLNLARKIKRRP